MIVEYDDGGLCNNGDIEFPCGELVDTVAGIQVWYSTNLKEYELLSQAQPTTLFHKLPASRRPFRIQ